MAITFRSASGEILDWDAMVAWVKEAEATKMQDRTLRFEWAFDLTLEQAVHLYDLILRHIQP